MSANCDSVEVTLNKLQKGRESPVKGRKAKDHPKESVKDAHLPKEAHLPEKPQIPVLKEEPEASAPKSKDTTMLTTNNQHVFKMSERENDKRKKDSKSDIKQATETSTNDNTKHANQEHEMTAAVCKYLFYILPSFYLIFKNSNNLVSNLLEKISKGFELY